MTPVVGQIYQHRHGGLYIVESVATHTGTKERLVVCEHLFPFEPGTWARPISEWTSDRFREVSAKEFFELTEQDREEFKNRILESKKKSQVAETKA